MIDLRSDTVTLPTEGMRRAMAKADLGDDVLGEDPTINRLETQVAQRLGAEAALFMPSGVMSNQIAIGLHCEPGDEFLCDQDAHVFQYEQAAFARFFGVCVQIVAGQQGCLPPELLQPRVRLNDSHCPRTRLVCLENTFNRLGGRVLPMQSVAETCDWARGQAIATHLDGARLWNACVATGAQPQDWARHFDTVSVCFSKGLGAPVGSALAGSRDLIARARRVRKALGGGMRQAGVLAAAALYALENHIDRLAEDHHNAQRLAEAVRHAGGLRLLDDRCDTNIVVFDVDAALGDADGICAGLKQAGVLAFAIGPQRVRLVTHLGVTRDATQQAADIIVQVAASAGSSGRR